ncbi:MAG TPA: DUF3108 domain-containing protein [Alphaproteobacteria bacterium]|nr:DUF3108 domain-containing protein [Alphaproteobacteria bacterium]
MMKRARALWAATIVCAFSAAASAEPLSLRYSATWGGGAAADIRLYLDERDGRFHNRLDLETVGLARWLSGFRVSATSTGQTEIDEVAPLVFDAIYDSRRKRDKRIKLQFVPLPGGSVAEEGPENTSTDPAIAEEFRRDVLDPLSCITAVRRLVRDGGVAPGKTFTLAVYDGKRRFDVEGTVKAVERLRWGKSTIEALSLQLLLRPVAGFDGETDDGYKPDAHTREMHVSVTNDRRAIPLRLSVPIAYVPAVVVLDRDTKL